MSADLVVVGSQVWVGDGTRTDALAVRGDRVVAHGEDARSLVGPRTRVLDTLGEFVVPGFQDSHIHAPPAGRNLRTVDLRDLTAALRTSTRFPVTLQRILTPWVTGGGWSMEHFPDGKPCREDLDAVTAASPRFCSTATCTAPGSTRRRSRVAGIDESTSDPCDGRYERDAGRDADRTVARRCGVLVRDAVGAGALAGRMGGRDPVRSQAYLHSFGITGSADAWVSAGARSRRTVARRGTEG